MSLRGVGKELGGVGKTQEAWGRRGEDNQPDCRSDAVWERTALAGLHTGAHIPFYFPILGKAVVQNENDEPQQHEPAGGEWERRGEGAGGEKSERGLSVSQVVCPEQLIR